MPLEPQDILYYAALWCMRPDLQKAFPEVAARDFLRYHKQWVETYGFGEYPAPRAIAKLPAYAIEKAKVLLSMETRSEEPVEEFEDTFAPEEEAPPPKKTAKKQKGRPLLCGFLQVYNEVLKGNLRRCLLNLRRYCDTIVAYDDGSSDGSYDVLREFMPKENILRGEENDLENELSHKQMLLDLCQDEIKPLWVYWQDADEVLDGIGTSGIREFAKQHINGPCDVYRFRELQLWLSTSWARVDSGFDEGSFFRLWRVNRQLSINVKHGTHHAQFPTGFSSIGNAPFNVLHYGNASASHIRYKAQQYAGGRGGVERHVNNDAASYMFLPKSLFPPDAEWELTPKPAPLPSEYRETLWYCLTAQAPRVAVVVPVHGDRVEMLKGAVESVHAQTYRNWELYVLMDGGTDRLAKYVEELRQSDPRIHAAIYPKNEGAVARMEIGFRIALQRADLWTRLGSDDAFLPTKLETDVAFAKANPKFGAWYGPYLDMDEKGNPKQGLKNPRVEPSEIKKRLRTEFIGSWANICVRTTALRQVLKKYDCFCDPRIRQMDDFVFNAKLAQVTPIGWSGPEHQALNRVWSGQASNTEQDAKDTKATRAVLEEIYDA